MILPYFIDEVQNKLLKTKLEVLATRGKPQENFIYSNLNEFKNSPEYKHMITSEDYYCNDNDIKEKKRKAIDNKGAIINDLLLPNNILSHPSLRNVIDEKVNYVFAQPFSIKCENESFKKLLEDEIFTDKFRRRLKNLATDVYKKGLSYLQPTFDKEGKLEFKLRTGDKIVPFWTDEEHTELDAYILFYTIRTYDLEGNYQDLQYIEFVDNTGVYRYLEKNKKLEKYEEDENSHFSGHFKARSENSDNNATEMVWERIPLIPFKSNSDEYPVIRSIKTLIDGYDTTCSDLADSIGDLPYSIKVVVNYDGQDLGELSANLYKYRMVKVSDGGDLKSLTQTIDITSINYHLDRLKDDICEYGRIVNDKTAVAVNASGKALDRIYNKIDLDANDIINEFNDSLEQLLWFVKWYFKNTGKGDFENEKVEFVFNTDKPTDETTIIANCVASKGIISDETILANHPWVTDVESEKALLEQEAEDQMNRLLNMNGYGSDPIMEENSEETLNSEEETDTTDSEE